MKRCNCEYSRFLLRVIESQTETEKELMSQLEKKGEVIDKLNSKLKEHKIKP